jgi:hypothetical protein
MEELNIETILIYLIIIVLIIVACFIFANVVVYLLEKRKERRLSWSSRMKSISSKSDMESHGQTARQTPTQAPQFDTATRSPSKITPESEEIKGTDPSVEGYSGKQEVSFSERNDYDYPYGFKGGSREGRQSPPPHAPNHINAPEQAREGDSQILTKNVGPYGEVAEPPMDQKPPGVSKYQQTDQVAKKSILSSGKSQSPSYELQKFRQLQVQEKFEYLWDFLNKARSSIKDVIYPYLDKADEWLGKLEDLERAQGEALEGLEGLRERQNSAIDKLDMLQKVHDDMDIKVNQLFKSQESLEKRLQETARSAHKTEQVILFLSEQSFSRLSQEGLKESFNQVAAGVKIEDLDRHTTSLERLQSRIDGLTRVLTAGGQMPGVQPDEVVDWARRKFEDLSTQIRQFLEGVRRKELAGSFLIPIGDNKANVPYEIMLGLSHFAARLRNPLDDFQQLYQEALRSSLVPVLLALEENRNQPQAKNTIKQLVQAADLEIWDPQESEFQGESMIAQGYDNDKPKNVVCEVPIRGYKYRDQILIKPLVKIGGRSG